MKREIEIKQTIAESKQDMLKVIPDLQAAIENEDWENVVQYANGFVVGACVINVAEGFLQD
jgi:hypothetical protein